MLWFLLHHCAQIWGTWNSNFQNLAWSQSRTLEVEAHDPFLAHDGVLNHASLNREGLFVDRMQTCLTP